MNSFMNGVQALQNLLPIDCNIIAIIFKMIAFSELILPQ